MLSVSPSSGTQPYTLQAIRLGVPAPPLSGYTYLLTAATSVGVCPFVIGTTSTGLQSMLRMSGQGTTSSNVSTGTCRMYRLRVQHIASGDIISDSVAYIDNL